MVFVREQEPISTTVSFLFANLAYVNENVVLPLFSGALKPIYVNLVVSVGLEMLPCQVQIIVS